MYIAILGNYNIIKNLKVGKKIMEINFDKYFNQKNIDFVERKVEKYLPDIYGQILFLKNLEKQNEIYDKICFFNNSKLLDLFNTYEYLKYEENSYTNWLAYYMGMRDGLKRKNKT